MLVNSGGSEVELVGTLLISSNDENDRSVFFFMPTLGLKAYNSRHHLNQVLAGMMADTVQRSWCGN
ncbi:hypothetical protein D9M71_156010 [compost metagenome]